MENKRDCSDEMKNLWRKHGLLLNFKSISMYDNVD